MADLPPLTALRAFEAAGRLLSFTAAAEELNVTQSAISRQIRVLEEHLGMRLFRRLPRAVVLTSTGDAYLRTVAQSFAQIQHATDIVSEGGRRCVLTLSCLPTLATKWAMPRLLGFSERHRLIEVRFSTSIRPADFARDTVDFAIRVGSPRHSRLARGRPRIDLQMVERSTRVAFSPLFPDVLVPVCGPALLRNGPRLSEVADLRNHVLIHNSTRPNAWPDWLRYQKLDAIRTKGEMSFGHFFMAMQAASEARGVALVPLILAIDELRGGSLLIPFSRAVESAGGYYLLERRADRDRPEHHLFRAWILAEAERSRKECHRLLRG